MSESIPVKKLMPMSMWVTIRAPHVYLKYYTKVLGIGYYTLHWQYPILNI